MLIIRPELFGMGRKNINTDEKLKVVCEAMADKKATNPSVLDIKDISAFADYFIICSANSPQQMKAIAEAIQEKLKACGVRMGHQEGAGDSAWILLDYGELIVHIFQEEARQFYNLEELWHNAVRLKIE